MVKFLSAALIGAVGIAAGIGGTLLLDKDAHNGNLHVNTPNTVSVNKQSTGTIVFSNGKVLVPFVDGVDVAVLGNTVSLTGDYVGKFNIKFDLVNDGYVVKSVNKTVNVVK